MKDMSDNKNRRVLVIDDNHSVHDDFRKILSPLKSTPPGLEESRECLFGSSVATLEMPPFEVDSAYQGEEGAILVKKAVEEARPYAMAFVDLRMPPGWDGVKTAQEIWKIDPDIQIVACTGLLGLFEEGVV
jgi:CheY-like chemotaxis protein